MGFFGDMLETIGGAMQKVQEEQEIKHTIDSMSEDELIEAANSGAWYSMYALNRLADEYFLQMDYQNAEFWSRKGVREHDPECLYRLGQIAFQQQKFKEYEDWHLRNINLNSDPNSASELGFLYLNFSDNPELPTDMEKASDYFNFALRQNPKHPEASYGLVCWVLKMDAVDDFGMTDFKRLLENATHSSLATIRDDAESILQDIEKRANF